MRRTIVNNWWLRVKADPGGEKMRTKKETDRRYYMSAKGRATRAAYYAKKRSQVEVKPVDVKPVDVKPVVRKFTQIELLRLKTYGYYRKKTKKAILIKDNVKTVNTYYDWCTSLVPTDIQAQSVPVVVLPGLINTK